MRRCLACHADFEAQDWRCPRCGAEPATLNGFPAFAPQLAQGEGFDAALFEELHRREARHFWFRARNRIILQALQRHAPQMPSLLEIGCGTGYVLSGIAAAFPDTALWGSEVSAAGLPYAAQRVPGARLMQMDARKLPFSGEFDVVGAFDVLEHIEQDDAALAEAHRALRPQGTLLLTVPQHPALWSQTDVAAGHVRRYTRAGLGQRLEDAGFRVLEFASFVSLLLPVMAASRWLKRDAKPDADSMAELRIGAAANALLGAVMGFERLLGTAGLRFPAGGSLLAAARRL